MSSEKKGSKKMLKIIIGIVVFFVIIVALFGTDKTSEDAKQKDGTKEVENVEEKADTKKEIVTPQLTEESTDEEVKAFIKENLSSKLHKGYAVEDIIYYNKDVDESFLSISVLIDKDSILSGHQIDEDIKDIIEIIKTNNINAEKLQVAFFGFSTGGNRGWLVKATFLEDTLNNINIDTLDYTDFKNIADEYNVKPNFKDTESKYYK